MRAGKTVGGVTHTYITDGSRIIKETWGNQYLLYFYDENGAVDGIEYYNGSSSDKYYFLKNLQGDVITVLNENGVSVANYSYDAWGKLLSITDACGNAITSPTHIANINPIRYRGYYYDSETGFYYLQSRYYDPTVERFINADCVDYLLLCGSEIGFNLFVYCENNPIIDYDPNGNLSARVKLSIIAGLAYGIYNTGGCYGMVLNSVQAWARVGLAFAKGFIKGFSAVYTFGKYRVVAAAIVAGTTSVISDLIMGNVKSAQGALK